MIEERIRKMLKIKSLRLPKKGYQIDTIRKVCEKMRNMPRQTTLEEFDLDKD